MKFSNLLHKPAILALILVWMLGAKVNAQSTPATREKVESMRIAFITERLNLTPEEAKQFWPIYNNYRHDLAQLRRSYYPNTDEGSNSHLDADRQLEFEQKRVDLRRHYKAAFEDAIGKAKVNKLVNAEEDFKRLLIQTMRNRRQQRPGWR